MARHESIIAEPKQPAPFDGQEPAPRDIQNDEHPKLMQGFAGLSTVMVTPAPREYRTAI